MSGVATTTPTPDDVENGWKWISYKSKSQILHNYNRVEGSLTIAEKAHSFVDTLPPLLLDFPKAPKHLR